MPQIEFEIDPRTGELVSHIKGVKGRACEDVQKALESLLGGATSEHVTEEYTQATVQPQGQIRGGARR